MNVSTDNRVVKTADTLKAGDRIPGKLSGIHVVTHAVITEDDMLGTVVRVYVRREEKEGEWFPARDYTFRTFDKLWVLS